MVRNQLARNHVQMCTATRGSSTRTRSPSRRAARSARITADNIVIAVGTRPNRPQTVEFDDSTVLDSDGILQASAPAAGAGRRRRRRDRHRVRLDVRRARHQGDRDRAAPPPARLLRRPDRRGAAVPPARHRRDLPLRRGGGRRRARTRAAPSRTSRAASGSRPTPCSTRPAGRAPPTRSTSRRPASTADSAAGSRSTSATGRPSPHIYAVGDVIGFPSLAATSMEQGRLAALPRLRRRAERDRRRCCRSASTRSRRSRSSARPRRS